MHPPRSRFLDNLFRTFFVSSSLSGAFFRTPALAALAALAAATSCRSTGSWRAQADRRAERILAAAQQDVAGRADPLVIETPSDTLRRRLLLDQRLVTFDAASLGIRDLPPTSLWNPAERLLPSTNSTAEAFAPPAGEPLRPTLRQAVQIAAAHSPAFQERKEALFSSALALDLEAEGFRSAFASKLEESVSSSKSAKRRSASDTASDAEAGLAAESASGGERSTGSTATGTLGVSRKFENGTDLSSSLAVDFAKMLTDPKDSAWGVSLDASLSVPLLRGSGVLVNREGLTKAERSLVYAVRDFEQYKRTFVVEIASAYLEVLNGAKKLQNQEDSYRRVITSTRRSRRMADAGRLQEYEFDQSYQQELSARNSWISAQQAYQKTLESFRRKLGLPPDALVEPLPSELEALQTYAESFAKHSVEAYNDGKPVPDAEDTPVLEGASDENAGPMEIPLDRALAIASTNRLDFQTAKDKVEDAQRAVLIAEDGLRAELTLGVSAKAGESRSASSASQGNGKLELGRATLGGVLTVDLPLHRTAERNAYRESLIALEKAVRDYQDAEDTLKTTLADRLRSLLETREQLSIQFVALSLAERRVRSTDLLMQSGRAEIRDVLEAQDALLSAQNALLSAVTGYRVKELSLQSDLGLLDVTADGTWTESPL